MTDTQKRGEIAATITANPVEVAGSAVQTPRFNEQVFRTMVATWAHNFPDWVEDDAVATRRDAYWRSIIDYIATHPAANVAEMTNREIMEEWDRHYLPGKAKGVPFLQTVVAFARHFMPRPAATHPAEPAAGTLVAKAEQNETVAQFTEKKAADFAREFGSMDTQTGILIFADEDHADTYSELLEHAAKRRAAPTESAAAPDEIHASSPQGKAILAVTKKIMEIGCDRRQSGEYKRGFSAALGAASNLTMKMLAAVGYGSAAAPADEHTQAARDVLAERRRQVEAEGWTPERDDNYHQGELVQAAVCYIWPLGATSGQARWPWEWAWFKPSDPRRNLVKAAALILADIERLDRAARPTGKAEQGEKS